MSQKETVLQHLMTGKHITQLEAMGVYRIFRLAARVCELKGDGYVIQSTINSDATGKKYARYWMRPSDIREVRQGIAA